MKKGLLLSTVLLAALSSSVSHAYNQYGIWTNVSGYVVGQHSTHLASNETGPASSAFVRASAFFANVNCPNRSSGLLTHPSDVGWAYAACVGGNTSEGEHYAIIHNYPTNVGFTFLNRVW